MTRPQTDAALYRPKPRMSEALRGVWTDALLSKGYGIASASLRIVQHSEWGCGPSVYAAVQVVVPGGLVAEQRIRPPSWAAPEGDWLRAVDGATCLALQSMQRLIATGRGGYA